jgi:hypothetical protein
VKQSEGCQGFSTAGKTIAAPKGAALFAEWSGAMRPPFSGRRDSLPRTARMSKTSYGDGQLALSLTNCV